MAEAGRPEALDWRQRVLAVALAMVLALLPWWSGVVLLVVLAVALVIADDRALPVTTRLRLALRWGVPGMAFALQRALGGDALAWGVALLVMLTGYGLLALLEHALVRARPRTDAAPAPTWAELARRPVGPPARIVELVPPQWHEESSFADPRGGVVERHGQAFRLADGTRLAGGERGCFSPDGRWFCVALVPRGVLLYDREHGRQHRLRDWQLLGWHAGEPWLTRGEDSPPFALRDALGEHDGTQPPQAPR